MDWNGINCERKRKRHGMVIWFYNSPINDFQTKLVLKPLSNERRWKFIYEPIHQDVRVLSKKIPMTKFLNFQVGIGHNFSLGAIGWKCKLTSCLGGDNISRIRNKTALGLCEGVDFRFGWRTDYVLPEITGALGTGEPLFNMNSDVWKHHLTELRLSSHTEMNNIPEGNVRAVRKSFYVLYS